MIEIRKYLQGDESEIAALVVGIQRGEFDVDVTFEEQPDLLDIAGYFRDGIGEFWVAIDGELVVGTIGLKNMGDGECALRKMFVAASHRGSPHKIAQRLLDIFSAYCGKVGVHRVILGTTTKYEAAHKFYERNGFRRIAEADLPENFPRMPVDNIFYQKLTS